MNNFLNLDNAQCYRPFSYHYLLGAGGGGGWGGYYNAQGMGLKGVVSPFLWVLGCKIVLYFTKFEKCSGCTADICYIFKYFH